MGESEFVWVFAYGAEMSLDDLCDPRSEHRLSRGEIADDEPALLRGYRLVWNFNSPIRKCGAANIEECDGRDLYGVALKLTSRALDRMDLRMGHPEVYYRGSAPLPVCLTADGKEIEAWVYFANPKKRSPVAVKPTKKYLDSLIRGAEDHRLPAAYIAELKATQVRPDQFT